MLLEVIFVSAFLLLLVWLLLLIISKRKLKKLLKNYDEKKDLSKKGEARAEYGARERVGGSEESKLDIAGQDEPEGRRVLPTTSDLPVRKNRKSSRGIFARRRKLRR